MGPSAGSRVAPASAACLGCAVRLQIGKGSRPRRRYASALAVCKQINAKLGAIWHLACT